MGSTIINSLRLIPGNDRNSEAEGEKRESWGRREVFSRGLVSKAAHSADPSFGCFYRRAALKRIAWGGKTTAAAEELLRRLRTFPHMAISRQVLLHKFCMGQWNLPSLVGCMGYK